MNGTVTLMGLACLLASSSPNQHIMNQAQHIETKRRLPESLETVLKNTQEKIVNGELKIARSGHQPCTRK